MDVQPLQQRRVTLGSTSRFAWAASAIRHRRSSRRKRVERPSSWDAPRSRSFPDRT